MQRSFPMEVQYLKPFGVKITQVDLDDPEHTKRITSLLYHNGIVLFPADAAKPGARKVYDVHSLDHLGKLFGTTKADHPINPYVGDTAVEVLETCGGTEKSPDSWIFHSDTTWRRDPNVASVISCRKKPSTGGATRFQRTDVMYKRLSEEHRKLLANSKFLHSLYYGYQNVNSSNKLEGVEERSYVHPGLINHPKTGVPLCYVNKGFTICFDGKSVEESRPILDNIFDEIYSEEETYTHNWTENDVVIWDNMGTHHQAPKDYFETRIMFRVISRDPNNVPQLYVQAPKAGSGVEVNS